MKRWVESPPILKFSLARSQFPALELEKFSENRTQAHCYLEVTQLLGGRVASMNPTSEAQALFVGSAYHPSSPCGANSVQFDSQHPRLLFSALNLPTFYGPIMSSAYMDCFAAW